MNNTEYHGLTVYNYAKVVRGVFLSIFGLGLILSFITTSKPLLTKEEQLWVILCIYSLTVILLVGVKNLIVSLRDRGIKPKAGSNGNLFILTMVSLFIIPGIFGSVLYFLIGLSWIMSIPLIFISIILLALFFNKRVFL